MKEQNIAREQGQSLILTALLMFVFIGILMLAIDGGTAFAKRRAAQNAADAGALAGVRTLCIEKDAVAAWNDATDYAQTYNEAVSSNVTIGERTVAVTTTIPYSTTFAHFFGFNQVAAQARAVAGCYSPGFGAGILPVAWSCRPPIEGGGLSDSGTCQMQRITDDELDQYIDQDHICPTDEDPNAVCPELYVVMDSESYSEDFVCHEEDPTSELICSFDGDNEIDWLASGGRSWLDLDGNDASLDCENTSEGASELTSWILNGFSNPDDPNDPNCVVRYHEWVPEAVGVAASIFQSVEERRQNNPLVILPVFDGYCPDGNPFNLPECQLFHPLDPPFINDDINPNTAQQPAYFHINGFSAFYITCVRLNNGDHCVGAERIEELNGNMPNLKSIEGYFLEGHVTGLGGIGDPNLDTGVYTFYLSH